jgi:hypothetical protein
MPDLAFALNALKDSLCSEIDVGGLFARNPIVHKWKAPWRALLLRESVAWRLQDLLEQSLILSRQNGALGARILLRSAFETLSVLIYLNRSMRKVVEGHLDFHEFSKKTSLLLLGSRDKSTNQEQISILTILGSANKRYPKLYDLYETLSESAHPNFEGMLFGYSTADHENHLTTFKNRWKFLYGQTHEDAIATCLNIFILEYNDESKDALEALEEWIALNDTQLKATMVIEE